MINECPYPHKVNEDGTITLVCGHFNRPNSDGNTYLLSEGRARAFKEDRIGKEIGEYPESKTKRPGGIKNITSHILTPAPTNSLGTIVDIELERVGDFKVIPDLLCKVTIDPRGEIFEMVKSETPFKLGLRALSSIVDAKTYDILNMVGYDLILDKK